MSRVVTGLAGPEKVEVDHHSFFTVWAATALMKCTWLLRVPDLLVGAGKRFISPGEEKTENGPTTYRRVQRQDSWLLLKDPGFRVSGSFSLAVSLN